MADVFGIDTPRDFQVEAINHCAFDDDSSLYLIIRTADGKSLVPLTTAILRRGITIVLVPLVGLGSDQVDKATVLEHGVKAYHIDEHKKKDARALRERLLSFTREEANYTTILIYINPQNFVRDPLRPNAGWFHVFATLAKEGLISLICIDEAHTVEQCGRNFRPEFLEATKSLCAIRKTMPRPVPIICMSATLRENDQDRLSKLLELDNPSVLSGSLERRSIMFVTKVSGDPASSIRTCLDLNLKEDQDKQILIYTNSKSNAEGALLEMAESLLEEKHLRTGSPMTYADSITGGDGIKRKTTTMDAVTSFSSIHNGYEPDKSYTISDITSSGDDPIILPPNQVVTATATANCGVSSNELAHCKHKGHPPTLYDVVQEMGRVNRMLLALPGSNTYEIHVSADSYVSLYVRTMTNSSPLERSQQLIHLNEVNCMLLLPSMCYHSFIELYFEAEPTPKSDCGQFCSYCLGHTKLYAGVFYKRKLVSILTTKIFSGSNKAPHYKSFIKTIKQYKEYIFHEEHIPKKKTGPIHALVLQLLAAGIISVGISDVSKIGTDKLNASHVVITLPNAMDEDGIAMPAHMIDELWDGLNHI